MIHPFTVCWSSLYSPDYPSSLLLTILPCPSVLSCLGFLMFLWLGSILHLHSPVGPEPLSSHSLPTATPPPPPPITPDWRLPVGSYHFLSFLNSDGPIPPSIFTSALKVEIVCFSKMLVSTYKSIRCHNPEEIILQLEAWSNLQSLD
jgi:hypothetical protein